MAISEMKTTEARTHLGYIVRSASMTGEETVITQNGEPAAVVIGIDEYCESVAAWDARIIERIRARAATAEYAEHAEVLREAGIQ